MTTTEQRPPGASRRLVAAGAFGALGVFLLAFDDVQPLRVLGGGVLASPGWIPLLLAGLLVAPGSRLLRRRLLVGGCAAIAAYAVVLTAVGSLIAPGEAYGERPFEKAVRVLGAFLIWLAVLLAGWMLARAVPRALLLGVGAMLLAMVLGAVLYRFGVHVIDDLPLLHSAANVQQRVRSTRFEASSLGGGMLAATALAVALLGRPRQRYWVCLGGLVATALLTDSRGTELIAAAGIVLLVVLQLVGRRARPSGTVVLVVAAAVAVLALASSLGLALIVQSDLWHSTGLSDGARGTSDATRAGWAFASTQVLVTAPLGLGFGAYLHDVPHLLNQAIDALSGTFGPSALAELEASAQGVSDVGVSPKTAPTLAAFHLGWVGVIALGGLWSAALAGAYGVRRNRTGSIPLFVATACVVLVAAGYYSSFTAWEQALAYGAVLGAASLRRGSRHRLDGEPG